MDIEELRQKQTDAINVLKRFGTIDALDWLLDCRADENPNFTIKEFGQWAGMTIKRHLSFQSGDSTCDLYLLGERAYVTVDGERTMGIFQLYLNSSLVLETTYHEETTCYYEGERIRFRPTRELDWSISSDYQSKDGKFHTFSGAVKTIKLSEWVETLPEIVKNQKQAIENQYKKDQQEKNKKIVSETSDNFDLGKYK